MDKQTYFSSIKNIRDSLPPDRRESFDLQFAIREKSPPVALILSLVIGTLGLDRFYLGNTLVGILKLITFGGLGIWTLIDWFLIMGAARTKNAEIAGQVRAQLA
jgi:TM2 domain-containing membrane protein YozV